MEGEIIKEKIEIIELVREKRFDEAMEKIGEVIRKGKIEKFNAYALDNLVKTLVKLIMDWERMRDYEREHYSKVALHFASRL